MHRLGLRTSLTAIGAVGLFFGAACSSSPGSSTPAPTPAPTTPVPGTDAGVDAAPPDAGPCTPKAGYETAVPLDGKLGSLYRHASLALSAKDEPLVAFVAFGDDPQASALYFAGYDLATCTWKAPVKVDTVGDLDDSGSARAVTLVRDASNDHLAIAYQQNTLTPAPNGDTHMMLAHSTDGGATWTKEEVAHNTLTPGDNDSHRLAYPTVAIANGKTAYAYLGHFAIAEGCGTHSECDAFTVLTRSGDSGAFAGGIVQSATGFPGAEEQSGALAMDAAGNASFVFYSQPQDTATSPTLLLNYVKVGETKATAVFDSQGTQSDQPGLALAFDGTKPRVASSLQRGATDTGTMMWFSASDDGATWSAPLELPGDGGDTMGHFLSVAADGKGTLSIASDLLGNSSTPGACGGPKLSTSTDLATWTTCGPALDPAASHGGDYVQLAYMKNGKRVMAFDDFNPNPNSPLASVIVWREP